MALDQLNKSAPGAVFTVDGGDTFQGSALAAWTKGEAILPPLNALGIDVGIPGNWEVVYGPEVLQSLMSRVDYKVIAYNFENKKTGQRLFAPYVLLKQNGVKVAFVGQTDITTTTRQPPAQVKGLDSSKSSGLREYIQKLKEKETPDLIVLVDLNGLTPMVEVAKEISEIDVILSNHTHERVYKPIRVGNTIIVESGSLGSFLGKLDLKIQDKKVVDVKYDFVPLFETEFPENKEVKALVEKVTPPYKKQLEKLWVTLILLSFFTMFWKATWIIGSRMLLVKQHSQTFTNGFRFSPPIAPGPITEGEPWNVLPLVAKLKIGKISGKQLWN